jgi:hypothetical protein
MTAARTGRCLAPARAVSGVGVTTSSRERVFKALLRPDLVTHDRSTFSNRKGMQECAK